MRIRMYNSSPSLVRGFVTKQCGLRDGTGSGEGKRAFSEKAPYRRGKRRGMEMERAETEKGPNTKKTEQVDGG